jgi:hypothetical protein
LVEQLCVGPKQHHRRGQNAILPGRIKLPARTQHGLSTMGARPKIRPRTRSRSTGRIAHFSHWRVHDRLRARFIARQRHRHWTRDAVHNQ